MLILAFETVNAMKLWREADDASTPVPKVEDDMNVKIVISSDALELSLAQIQLELEAFQLGSAWLICWIFSSSRVAKNWQIKLFVLFIVWFPTYGYFLFQLQICEIFEEYASDLVNNFQKITIGTCTYVL